jgi:uncharacterized protein (UPF0333 family)
MKFLKKLNRGAIVFAALLLCVLVAVIAISVSTYVKLSGAENAVSDFLYDAVTIKKQAIKDNGGNEDKAYEQYVNTAQKELSAYFKSGEVDLQMLNALYENEDFDVADSEGMGSPDDYSIVFYKDGTISFTYYLEFDEYLEHGMVFVMESVDGQWKIAQSGSEYGYEINDDMAVWKGAM